MRTLTAAIIAILVCVSSATAQSATPVTITTSLPDAHVGSTLSIVLQARGGAGPYTWTVVGGTLPPNLTISSDGLLAGSPTTTGTWSFTVQAADALGATSSRQLTLAVQSYFVSPTLIYTALPIATVGVPYATALHAELGSPPYTWSIWSGSLPPGMALGTNGTISGTPTSPGMYGFWIGVADQTSAQAQAVHAFELTIDPAASPTGGQLLVSGLHDPGAVAVDTTYVYWAEYGSGLIRRAAKDGSGAVTLYDSASNARALMVAGGYVYFADDAIRRVPMAGGPVETIAAGQRASDLVTDGTLVYWTDDVAGQIKSTPVIGGTVTTLASGQVNPGAIGLVGGYVVWSEFANPGRLRQVPTGGGAVMPLAVGTNTTGLAVSSGSVFYADNALANHGGIWSFPVPGSALFNRVDSLESVWDVAVDGTDFFWSENRRDGTIRQKISGLSFPVTLATGQREPIAIAVDSTHVYWINRDGGAPSSGSLWRAAKESNRIDTTYPEIRITSPTTASTYFTTSSTLALSGVASDDGEIDHVSWTNERGGSGRANGTTNWTVSGINLVPGENLIWVSVSDVVGHVTSDVLIVTYSPPDSTPPTITILGPTAGPSYSQTHPDAWLNGTVSDNVMVKQVTWANNRGGSGIASITDIWRTAIFPLQPGENVITVTAEDLAGNTAVDTLTITYTAATNDPLLASQWHLKPRSHEVSGANVLDAWNLASGAGVVIGLVDDGLQRTHPDLAPNFMSSLSFDFNDNDSDPSPGSTNYHGTATAGLAAARGDNAIGVAGVAKNAGLAGLRLIAAPVTDAQQAAAMAYESSAIHISSNSWGPFDDGRTLGAPGPLTASAIQTAATTGRGGKGRVFVWAAGNGRTSGDNCNYDGWASNPYVIAVGALDDAGQQAYYSESCSALMATAPSSGGARGIVTTDIVGASGYSSTDYTTTFGGTSAAAPEVAGVVGLMLSRNSTLTTRDVQHILARTSVRINPTDSGWTSGATPHNEKYGFGLVDASAAVTMASTWTAVAPQQVIVSAVRTVNLAVPDNNASGVIDSIAIANTPNLVVERVEVEFTTDHAWRGDLNVTLTSPSGVVSNLAPFRASDSADDFASWKFRSVRHWGELANGSWTLTVSDRIGGIAGTWRNWRLRVYGYNPIAVPPVPTLIAPNSATGTQTPTFTWYASSGATRYELYVSDASQEGRVNRTLTAAAAGCSDGTGACNASPNVMLALGAARWWVLAGNAAGDSAWSQPMSFTVTAGADTAPPIVTITAPTIGPTYATSTTPLVIGGTATDNFGVTQVTWVNLSGGSGTASGTTAWSAAIPLQQGANVIAVTAHDAAGNLANDSFTVTYTPAVSPPPTPTLISPNGATGTQTPTFTWNAASGATRYDLYVNDANQQGRINQTVTATAAGCAAGTGTCSVSPGVTLALGAGQWWVLAGNTSGNSSWSAAMSFTVTAGADTTVPAITITNPTAAPAHTTTSASLVIGGTASDNIGVTQVTWTNDRGGSGTANGTTAWSMTVALQAGDNVITVTARDAANNVGTDTLTVAYNAPAGPPPTPTLVSPNAATGTQTPTFTWNAASGATRYDLYVNDANQQGRINQTVTAGAAGCAAGTGTCSVSPGVTLALGGGQWWVLASNASGNSAWSAAMSFTVTAGADTLPPIVSITTPTIGPTHSTSSASLAIGGTASDNIGVTQVTWTNDRGGSGTASGTTAWSATVPLQAGDNLIAVMARDAANNTATDSFTVTYTPAVSPPPTPTLVSPNAATGTQTPTFTWNAASGATRYDLYVNDANQQGRINQTVTATAAGCAAGTGTCSVSPGVTLALGAGQWWVLAGNTSGNSSWSAAMSFTVTAGADTTVPAITITNPTAAPAHTTTSASLVIGGTASDNIGVTQVTWTNDRGGSGTASGTTAWSMTVALQVGDNVITVTARDAANNVATDTLTVTYNAPAGPPPTPTLVSPNAATGTQTPTFTWNASSGATRYDLYVNDANQQGRINQTVTATAVGCAAGTGTCSVSPGVTLALGVGQWWVLAGNTSGNSSWSAAMSFTVTAGADTTAPSVTITSPTAGATYSTTSSSLAMGGTANDNIGVTQVTWASDRGGSGTASGTTSWSMTVTLQSGDNVITVTARDAANNTATDTLTVTYTPSAGPPAPPVLISPAGVITTNVPTYTWNASPGATRYELWVNDATKNGRVNVAVTANAAGCGSGTGTCSVTPQVALASGQATWWVLAATPPLFGDWSAPRVFIVP